MLDSSGFKATEEYFKQLRTVLADNLVYNGINELTPMEDQFIKGKIVMLDEILSLRSLFETDAKETEGKEKE